MDTLRPLECKACKSEIWPRDARWYHAGSWSLDPSVYCDRCVEIKPWTIQPDALLLPPMPRRSSRRHGKGRKQ